MTEKAILLRADERDRFAEYLEHEAATDAALADKMETLGHTVAAKRKRVEATAARIVAAKLRATEDG